ncbi:MAG: HD-GYP domain-containing protein [Bdellovibrionota bacterium]
MKKIAKKPKQKQADNLLHLPISVAAQESKEKFAEEVYPDVLIEALRAIVSTLDEKDSYTHGHSIRVSEYAVILGEELNLSEIEIREVELAALLHDVGKIGIPDNILLKPGRLTQAEFEIMKSHPVRTGKILEKITALRHLIPGIVHHHERFDGLGYPSGLKGDGIPLYARIILIADTFDAMTSTRPYRLALDKEIAFEELNRCSGSQFDPYLVQCFIKAVRQLEQGETRRERISMVKKIA